MGNPGPPPPDLPANQGKRVPKSGMAQMPIMRMTLCLEVNRGFRRTKYVAPVASAICKSKTTISVASGTCVGLAA
jgi:hypothetical protein